MSRKQSAPYKATAFALASATPQYYRPLLCDNNGHLFVTIADPGTSAQPNVKEMNADGLLATNNGLVCISAAYVFNGASFDRVRGESANADDLTPSAVGNLATISQLYGWNGAGWDRIRAANVYKNLTTAATGPTAVWTPAAGKKFRLMGYTLSVAGTLAATGPLTITLLDGATAIANHMAFLQQTPSASAATQGQNFPCDLGQGLLSAAANNVLNIELSAALGTGLAAINVWGTEE